MTSQLESFTYDAVRSSIALLTPMPSTLCGSKLNPIVSIFLLGLLEGFLDSTLCRCSNAILWRRGIAQPCCPYSDSGCARRKCCLALKRTYAVVVIVEGGLQHCFSLQKLLKDRRCSDSFQEVRQRHRADDSVVRDLRDLSVVICIACLLYWFTLR